ncbi:PREDICTED: X-box-binding protein 1 [Nicrophorus vespilloides]|uniref:X-box-binding protein 1 n=1 Tax=Nicrophorus vespilloides TaxID=110193 RepID=A0ABM1MDK5_NICVS|nr:PREDICTED: X-box-binding protein 1 [Nicrophorus vespilloides]
MDHISDTSSYIMLEDSQDYVMPVRAKKRRLDHLSWEEKLQRKKLKNRVAAQTSRDRKKAKMDQMETTVNNLVVQNDTILSELEKLKRINEKLVRENKELTQKLREPCQVCSQSRSVECGVQIGSTVSNLLPQGLNRHSAATLSAQTLPVLLKIVMAYLLYQTSSTRSPVTSISPPWVTSHRVSSKTLPETWRQLLKKQILKNQMQCVGLRKWWGRHQNNWNPVEV